MKDPQARKRVVWIAALGGAVLLGLLFISLAAPSPSPSAPVIRPGTEAAATEAPASASGGGFSLGGGEIVSLALRLGLVVVIIAISVVALRWWGRKTSGPRSTTGFLRVIDTLAIANGRTIHLVALGDRVIAVGATAQQLSLLNELTGEEARDLLSKLPQGREQSLGGFAAELFQSMRRDLKTRPLPPVAEEERL